MTARTMALAALALIGLVGPSAADEDWPLRGNLFYRLYLPVWPAVQPSWKLAPWYMWWPADANETLKQHDFQSSPYPTWQASPPQAAVMSRPQGQMTYSPPTQQYRPSPYQPVSYPRTQVPSYWYGR